MKRRCGNCYYFIKLKHDPFSSGLCNKFDCRVNIDSGKDCEKWKGIKYSKNLVD